MTPERFHELRCLMGLSRAITEQRKTTSPDHYRTASTLTPGEMWVCGGNADCEVAKTPDGSRWLYDARTKLFERAGT